MCLSSFYRSYYLVLCALLVCSIVWAENTAVLTEDDLGYPPPAALNYHLRNLADEAFAERRKTYEAIETPEDVAAYQKRMKEFFVEQLGGFPERTPLNARVAGALERESFRVEKIIYESRPGFFVTATLYLPKADPPYPGVLVPCGHSANGKGAEAYQRASMLLAANGMAALCYDPIGQGERYQILKEDGTRRFGSTLEHTLAGVGSILLGTNTAMYRIYDGMRGLDYLASRPDIDAERLACTGNSGGGTLTSYIMALDERVVCAAPSCYLTSFDRLIDTIGPQDAEQDVFGQIAYGMDHAEYVIMRAPKPTLICAATGDFFAIGGTWDMFRDAKRVYTRLGYSERAAIVETDAEHGFSTHLRVAMVRWMSRWLRGIDEPVEEPDFALFSDEELQCTPEGQVLLLDGARSVFDLNKDRLDSLARGRNETLASVIPPETRQEIQQLIGAPAFDDVSAPAASFENQPERDSNSVERVILRGADGFPLPALLYVPPDPSGIAYVVAHGAGKAAVEHSEVMVLVDDGHLVLNIDLRGVGETESTAGSKGWTPYFGPDWQDIMLAYLLGKTHVGMRVADIYTAAKFLNQREDLDASQGIRLIASGETAVPALHAAALAPDVFDDVELEELLTSWGDVVRTPITRNQLVNAVHGALAHYDLPDLERLIPKGTLTILSHVNAAGEPVRN